MKLVLWNRLKQRRRGDEACALEPAEAAPPAARRAHRGGSAGVLPDGGREHLVDVRLGLLRRAAQLVGQEVPYGARPLPLGPEAPRRHARAWPILLVHRVSSSESGGERQAHVCCFGAT